MVRTPSPRNRSLPLRGTPSQCASLGPRSSFRSKSLYPSVECRMSSVILIALNPGPQHRAEARSTPVRRPGGDVSSRHFSAVMVSSVRMSLARPAKLEARLRDGVVPLLGAPPVSRRPRAARDPGRRQARSYWSPRSCPLQRAERLRFRFQRSDPKKYRFISRVTIVPAPSSQPPVKKRARVPQWKDTS